MTKHFTVHPCKLFCLIKEPSKHLYIIHHPAVPIWPDKSIHYYHPPPYASLDYLGGTQNEGGTLQSQLRAQPWCQTEVQLPCSCVVRESCPGIDSRHRIRSVLSLPLSPQSVVLCWDSGRHQPWAIALWKRERQIPVQISITHLLCADTMQNPGHSRLQAPGSEFCFSAVYVDPWLAI